MGKHDASVAWSEISAAIAANPNRLVSLHDSSSGGAAAASIAAMPTTSSASRSWLGDGWTEDTSCTIPDVVSFALWVRDPLYRVATASVRRVMEMEEAAWLLENSEAMWRTHNGKVRGWTRKHLEEDLRARSGGADAAPDVWEAVRTTRRTALLVDYVCCVRGLCLALWWPEHKVVTVIPSMAVAGVPITQINAQSARVLIGPAGFQMSVAAWPSFLLSVKDYSWVAPACAPAIGTMTVAQIHEALDELLGATMTPRTGNRAALWRQLQWERFVRTITSDETNKGETVTAATK